MSKADLNKSMINLLSFNNLSEMIINSCPSLVKSLCGKELYIQRRAHTIINVPGKGQQNTVDTLRINVWNFSIYFCYMDTFT